MSLKRQKLPNKIPFETVSEHDKWTSFLYVIFCGLELLCRGKHFVITCHFQLTLYKHWNMKFKSNSTTTCTTTQFYSIHLNWILLNIMDIRYLTSCTLRFTDICNYTLFENKLEIISKNCCCHVSNSSHGY